MSLRIPPQAVFADYAAATLAERTGWDLPHEFATLHWDGEKLTVGTLAVIMPDMPPPAYPGLMAGLAEKAVAEERAAGRCALYGYALLIEAFGVTAPAGDAPPHERERFARDRIGRRFHTREDAVEIASIHVVDIHQRLWVSTKGRESGKTEHHFYPAMDGAMSGAFIAGLRAIAESTARTLWGLS